MRTLLVSALIVASVSAVAAPRLTVSFANPAWDGARIPAGQQCSKLGGQGAAPPLNVFDLPANTQGLLIEYSERGGAGLGTLLFNVNAGVPSAQLPPVPASGALPRGMTSIAPATGGGQYGAPCTPGKSYQVVVKALAGKTPQSPVLAEGRLALGTLN
ncbi:hypothetical protein ACTSKR_05615 [Chitinibacteraceae bacterium HSL-7]